VNVAKTELPGVLILEPKVFCDWHGHSFVSYDRRAFREANDRDVEFVQDNESLSARNALRGLYCQFRQP
jgi:dTDP-4-dehydrorhamnose 3,5-epimerase